MASETNHTSLTPRQQTCLVELHTFIEDALVPTAIADFTNHGLKGDAFIRRVQCLESFLKATSFPKAYKDKLRAMVQDYLHDADAPHGQHVEIIKVTAACMTRVLTAAWVGAISKTASGSAAGNWLRLDLLDDSLLPRNKPEVDTYFADILRGLGKDTVTPDEGRELLKAVREKAGGGLPQPMCDFLAACNVLVVR